MQILLVLQTETTSVVRLPTQIFVFPQVRSELPSGYGGHVPTVQHDVLHQNTALYTNLVQMGLDPNR